MNFFVVLSIQNLELLNFNPINGKSNKFKNKILY
jgi:hypothetical protein